MAIQTTYSNTMAAGFPGMKADSTAWDDCPTYASAEASAEIPFGVFVCKGAADNKAILPVDATSVPVGIVVHSHEYVPTVELGTTGIKPKIPMAVMKTGRIWVWTEETVAKGDQCFMRHTSGAGGTQKGAVRKSADTATAVAVTGAVFHTARTGAGLVQVSLSINI